MLPIQQRYSSLLRRRILKKLRDVAPPDGRYILSTSCAPAPRLNAGTGAAEDPCGTNEGTYDMSFIAWVFTWSVEGAADLPR